MPNTNQRKQSSSAQSRMWEKYIKEDDKSHPYHLYIPNKKATDELRKLMDSRNYIRILTQTDKNLYITLQYWIYSEMDIWMCGDSFTFNNNPNKKIWVKPMCSARKGPCLCNGEGYTKEFISICPKCRKVGAFVDHTDWECSYCKYVMNHNDVHDLPYAKIPCKLCPIEIGWETVHNFKELVFENLVLREHVMKRKMKEQIEKGEEDG